MDYKCHTFGKLLGISFEVGHLGGAEKIVPVEASGAESSICPSLTQSVGYVSQTSALDIVFT